MHSHASSDFRWMPTLAFYQKLFSSIFIECSQVYMHIKKKEVGGTKKKRKLQDMQMSSTHIENVTLDVLAACTH